MSENGTKNDQEVLVCHVEGLEAYRADKTPVSKIPSDLPQWKQELLRKKEKKKLEKHRKEMAKLYEDSQTPEWMKPLKKLHQRRKSEQSEKEEAERRKAEEEKQRFEALPAWKKQLIFKKRAKSADNLLAGRDETKESPETIHSDCKAKEKMPVENGKVSPESDAGTNRVDDVNEKGISDNEKLDDNTGNHKVETSIDEIESAGKHDEDVGNTKDDGEQAVDLDKNDSEIEIAEKIDELSDNADDQKVNTNTEENKDDDGELKAELSDNTSEGEESPCIPNDNEEDSPLLEPDEDELKETGNQQDEHELKETGDRQDEDKVKETGDQQDEDEVKETGDQQVEKSGKPEEAANNNEDKNGE